MIDEPALSSKAITNIELEALAWISANEGCFVYQIPNKNDRDFLGELTPGLALVKKLDKKGLVIITEEETMDDGFQFTPTIEMTDLGRVSLAKPNL